MPVPFRRLLVANRSEIAIRVFRAANELGMTTVAVYAEEDKLSLHRFKADEAYQIGKGKGPIEAYLSIDEIIRVAKEARRRRHPSRLRASVGKPGIRRACAAAGIIFIGPSPETMRTPRQQGRGAQSRRLGRRAGDAGDRPPCPTITDEVKALAARDRLSGDAEGVLGRRRARHARHPRRRRRCSTTSSTAKREAKAAFGKDEVYLEKLVERARHVEVQVLGDSHGNLVHLFERDCSIQRRNQKVVERAPAPYLDDDTREELVRRRAQDRRRHQLCRRRHGRIPAWMPTPANSISSRSIRASRSSTPSPRR